MPTRICSWCNNEAEGACEHCTSILHDRPIPKDIEAKVRELYVLCSKMQLASTGQMPLEVESETVADRLIKIMGRDLTWDEILNKTQLLERELRDAENR